MVINDLIETTLATLNIPISLLRYIGNETTYVVYMEYLQQTEGFSEDDEEIVGHYVQLNLFSNSDYTSYVTQIKSLMKEAGFKRQGEYDLFEEAKGIYNHVFRFFYSETL